MFSYRITHSIFSTGDATLSNKLLKTKICSESLKFLLLTVNLEGLVSKYNVKSVLILELFTVAPSFIVWFRGNGKRAEVNRAFSR